MNTDGTLAQNTVFGDAAETRAPQALSESMVIAITRSQHMLCRAGWRPESPSTRALHLSHHFPPNCLLRIVSPFPAKLPPAHCLTTFTQAHDLRGPNSATTSRSEMRATCDHAQHVQALTPCDCRKPLVPRPESASAQLSSPARLQHRLSEEERAVAGGVEAICRSGSSSIWRRDVHDSTGGSVGSIFRKSHATTTSSAIFGCDSSRIVGGFGSSGGSILLQLCERGGGERKEGRMIEQEVFLDVCHRMNEIANSEDALRTVWRQITGTGHAKSHNVMHMQHKHGKDNELAAALCGWLEEHFLDVAGDEEVDE
jgi:hypothetical protein